MKVNELPHLKSVVFIAQKLTIPASYAEKFGYAVEPSRMLGESHAGKARAGLTGEGWPEVEGKAIRKASAVRMGAQAARVQRAGRGATRLPAGMTTTQMPSETLLECLICCRAHCADVHTEIPVKKYDRGLAK